MVRGDGNAEAMRREDMFPGERQKLDATRLRWNFTRWGQQQHAEPLAADALHR